MLYYAGGQRHGVIFNPNHKIYPQGAKLHAPTLTPPPQNETS